MPRRACPWIVFIASTRNGICSASTLVHLEKTLAAGLELESETNQLLQGGNEFNQCTGDVHRRQRDMLAALLELLEQ